MQLLYKGLLKIRSRMSHSIRMIRDQSTKKKVKSIIIQSIERRMTNAYVMKNTSSRNVHTSSNSIEKRDEKRTKMSETR
jgi:hypothetical protein